MPHVRMLRLACSPDGPWRPDSIQQVSAQEADALVRDRAAYLCDAAGRRIETATITPPKPSSPPSAPETADAPAAPEKRGKKPK